MRQIVHIFQKGVRRHWPEILISLLLLGLFTRHELHPWQNAGTFSNFSPFFSILGGRYITPVLIIFWAFLIVRVVQGESLVGDRQWWVTKPYVWWKLLAARILFILIIVCVPLFHSQLFLLHKAGFPILPNLLGILGMQFALFLALFLSGLTLGSLTKNIGQALLGVAAGFLILFGIFWLINRVPGGSMEMLSDAEQYIQTGLLIGCATAVPVWQFARRRTWASRGVLLAALVASASISILAPYGKPVQKIYRLLETRDAPVQIAIRPLGEMNGRRRVWSDFVTEVNLRIPVAVSGVTPGTMALLDGINITADTPEETEWNRGWEREYIQVWPEDQRKDLLYEMDRKEYEKVKTRSLHLHIELAMSEYQEADVRILRISDGRFFDKTLGECRIDPMNLAQIQCLKPIQAPGFMATFAPQNSVCAADEDGDRIQEDAVSHAWHRPQFSDFPDPGLNPVMDYSIIFGPSFVLRGSSESETKHKQKVLHLCPGAEIRLARPEFKRQVRIKLEMKDVRLQDLVEADWRWR